MELLASIQKKSYFSLMNHGLAHIQRLDMGGLKRAQVKTKLGRQNFYLYSAVNPRNGESSSSNVNTDCMNIFLEQMSQYLGIREAFLESALCKFITSLASSTIKQLCNVSYLTGQQ